MLKTKKRGSYCFVVLADAEGVEQDVMLSGIYRVMADKGLMDIFNDKYSAILKKARVRELIKLKKVSNFDVQLQITEEMLKQFEYTIEEGTYTNTETGEVLACMNMVIGEIKPELQALINARSEARNELQNLVNEEFASEE